MNIEILSVTVRGATATVQLSDKMAVIIGAEPDDSRASPVRLERDGKWRISSPGDLSSVSPG